MMTSPPPLGPHPVPQHCRTWDCFPHRVLRGHILTIAHREDGSLRRTLQPMRTHPQEHRAGFVGGSLLRFSWICRIVFQVLPPPPRETESVQSSRTHAWLPLVGPPVPSLCLMQWVLKGRHRALSTGSLAQHAPWEPGSSGN